jgi:hypothetical protein
MVALSGCGSAAPAALPAATGPPASPPLTTAPAGEVSDGRQVGKDTVVDGGRTYSIDRDGNRLELAAGAMTKTQRTCHDPVALAMVDHGAGVAVLCGRGRALELFDASTLERLGRSGAGLGPTDLATNGSHVLYVTDAVGDALLVFRLKPLRLVRRVHVAGGPYAIAYDREGAGLWIALAGANQLVNYAAGLRPVMRQTLPSIRDARAVSVDAGVVTVFGQDQRQVVHVRAK